jgi:hypothetical protein
VPGVLNPGSTQVQRLGYGKKQKKPADFFDTAKASFESVLMKSLA